jgi:hypothetical protein
MVIIFFGGELSFGNFIGPGFRNILLTGPGGIFSVLFPFGMGFLRKIFRFKEEVFAALVLSYGILLFGIGYKVGTALTGVGSFLDLIFGSVIHEG